MSADRYRGTELPVFAHARRWKAYVRALIGARLRGDVLEVGAGIGATTAALCDGRQSSWTALEPDERLASELRSVLARLPFAVEAVCGTTDGLGGRRFDCVLYIDVLEHIEDDAGELQRAAGLLRPAGTIIVVGPAHQWLYTPFDAAIGHHRRYSRSSLRALQPPGVTLETLRYIDSAGLLLSLGNRLLLRSASPTRRQILAWDGWFVPISRHLDVVLVGHVGKSILAAWRAAPSRVGSRPGTGSDGPKESRGREVGDQRRTTESSP